MICRGVQARRTLIHPKDLPPLTVKEALEVYYSLKRSDKSLQMEQRWKYLNDRFIFQNFNSSFAFLQACSSMLKTVNHFEEKVKATKRNPTLMKKWNDKLNVLLSIPFHDNLNTVTVASKFKAYEFPESSGEVGGLCMNCPNAGCRGCATSRVMMKVEVKPTAGTGTSAKRLRQRQRQGLAARSFPGRTSSPPGHHGIPHVPHGITVTKVAERVRAQTAFGSSPTGLNNSGPPGGTPNQRIYYEATNVWKTKEEMKKEYWRVGKLMGYRRPASLTEVLDFYSLHGQPEPSSKPHQPKPSLSKVEAHPKFAAPVTRSFRCPNCPKKAFKSEGDLNRHKSAKCERDKLLFAREKQRQQQQAASDNPPVGIDAIGGNEKMPMITSVATLAPTSSPAVHAGGAVEVISQTMGGREFQQPFHDDSETSYHYQQQEQQQQQQQQQQGVMDASAVHGQESSSSMPWMLPAEDCSPNDDCILPD